MYSLLSAIWLCLPAAPLNPIEQDTLPDFSVHFSVGAIGPNGVLTAGQEFSVHYEVLAVHPILVRGGIDYSYGEITSLRYPAGNLHTGLLTLELLYYRGTNGLIGYFGGGVVYA